MSWTIEGKISEWTLISAGTATLEIRFRIKAANEYSVKINKTDYNCFVADPISPPKTALLFEQSKDLNANILFLPVFTSCKDNTILFELDGAEPDNLKNITVK